jgi:hypothetical protein
MAKAIIGKSQLSALFKLILARPSAWVAEEKIR